MTISPRSLGIAALSLVAAASAQVPQGYYVFSTFGPARGPVGLFVSHPRDPMPPTPITDLFGDLTLQGPSSCLITDDGTLVVGERVAGGSGRSVDIHLITLEGLRAYRDIVISVGVGGSCCGEIPQADMLSDGRIVVAATDIEFGALATIQTLSYGNEGVGIIDPTSGLVTALAIDNPPTRLTDGVFNGLAVSPDEQTVYIANYVSSGQGDIWSLPLPGGGTPTLVATVPSGCSNLSFGADGSLWVTGLGALPDSVFRVDVNTGSFQAVPTANVGASNAIDAEGVTFEMALVTANAGTPSRAVFWLEADGTEHLLTAPNLATPSGISFFENPNTFGTGSPGDNAYAWNLDPTLVGGLPLVGNSSFQLVLEGTGPAPDLGTVLLSLQRLATPIEVLGIDLLVDPGMLIGSVILPAMPSNTLSLPIPADPTLPGLSIHLQSIHLDSGATAGFAASNGCRFTVL